MRDVEVAECVGQRLLSSLVLVVVVLLGAVCDSDDPHAVFAEQFTFRDATTGGQGGIDLEHGDPRNRIDAGNDIHGDVLAAVVPLHTVRLIFDGNLHGRFLSKRRG